MDEDKASRFISSLVKSIQALCNGFVDFSTSIEVIGHIHLNIDRSVKLDYVLTEEVSKSVSEGSTVFSSHSYHSQAPPSITSKSASDTSNHGQKSRKDNEADPLGLSALPREVPNTSKSDSHSLSSNRVGDSSNSSHTFSGSVGFSRNSDSESVKLENNRSSCQVEDSSNKRRKMGPLSQTTPPPAAKRGRSNDFGSGSKTVVQESGFEVIEIKEEPDDDVPAVFFGSSGSGQDIQTPDFSNVVMESLDRVNQLEQSTDLVDDGGEGMGTPQQPVFPVMFHQSDGMPSSSAGPVPGPLSDPQSIASTSGEDGGGQSTRPHTHTRFAPFGGRDPLASLGRLPHQPKWRTDLQPLMFGGRPRARLQYSTQQMARAIAEVEEGKPVRLAAREHGIPLRSLYHRLKMRSSSSTRKASQDQPRDRPSMAATIFTDEELQISVQLNEKSQ